MSTSRVSLYITCCQQTTVLSTEQRPLRLSLPPSSPPVDWLRSGGTGYSPSFPLLVPLLPPSPLTPSGNPSSPPPSLSWSSSSQTMVSRRHLWTAFVCVWAPKGGGMASVGRCGWTWGSCHPNLMQRERDGCLYGCKKKCYLPAERER